MPGITQIDDVVRECLWAVCIDPACRNVSHGGGLDVATMGCSLCIPGQNKIRREWRTRTNKYV